jgi:hypothetical protein
VYCVDCINNRSKTSTEQRREEHQQQRGYVGMSALTGGAVIRSTLEVNMAATALGNTSNQQKRIKEKEESLGSWL